MQICRWVLVRMSSNFGLTGCSVVNSEQKKARECSHGATYLYQFTRLFIFLMILLISVAFVWSVAVMEGQNVIMKETVIFTEEKVQIFLKLFNVSKEQIHAFDALFRLDKST